MALSVTEMKFLTNAEINFCSKLSLKSRLKPSFNLTS